MSWVRKSGGVISVYFSVLLGVAGLVISAALYQANVKKKIFLQSEIRQIRHFIYLEMLYYVRNEIYDGYYSSLQYDVNSWDIRVRFNKKEKIASLRISNDEFESIHRILYDTDCRCILDVTEGLEVDEDTVEKNINKGEVTNEE